jgi:hypothetical protein
MCHRALVNRMAVLKGSADRTVNRIHVSKGVVDRICFLTGFKDGIIHKKHPDIGIKCKICLIIENYSNIEVNKMPAF